MMPGSSLASGVALLVLPATALVAVAVAGFLHTPREGVGLAGVMLAGLGLAAAAAVVNGPAGKGQAGEEIEPRQRRWRAVSGLLIALALLLLAVTGLMVNGIADRLLEPVAGPGDWESAIRQAKAFPLLSWSGISLGWLAVALALPRPRAPSGGQDRRDLVAYLASVPPTVLIAAGAAALVWIGCVRPVQADVLFKMADSHVRSGSWELVAGLYGQAIELAPREDFYYLMLGRAQLEQARGEETSDRPSWLAQARETLERASALNPLNPDHAANLARFHWQAADLEDAMAREAHLRAADGHYARATVLAPRNVVLLNEWAGLKWYAFQDERQACQLLDRSLELDPAYEWTQKQYADICAEVLLEGPLNLDFEE